MGIYILYFLLLIASCIIIYLLLRKSDKDETNCIVRYNNTSKICRDNRDDKNSTNKK